MFEAKKNHLCLIRNIFFNFVLRLGSNSSNNKIIGSYNPHCFQGVVQDGRRSFNSPEIERYHQNTNLHEEIFSFILRFKLYRASSKKIPSNCSEIFFFCVYCFLTTQTPPPWDFFSHLINLTQRKVILSNKKKKYSSLCFFFYQKYRN